jgi:excisionase family DNA binding protein
MANMIQMKAVAFLSVSRATLYRLVRAGEVPAKKLNGRKMSLREELSRFLRALPDGGAMGVACSRSAPSN